MKLTKRLIYGNIYCEKLNFVSKATLDNRKEFVKMKYDYMNNSSEKFINIAINIFSKLSEEEKSKITYGELVEKTAEKYFNDRECGKSEIKNGYRFFKMYYDTHFLVTTNRIKKSNNKITFADIKELFLYDLRKNLILVALDDNYHYYSIEIPAIDENGKRANRTVLIIETDTEAVDNTYEIISKYFDELIDSMFYGYGGLALIFKDKNDYNTMIEYIKK